MSNETTVESIEGPWIDSEFESSLISRCKNAWKKPITDLTNQELSTFLRQRIAVTTLRPIAENRIKIKFEDGTEQFDEELEEALKYATKNFNDLTSRWR